MRRYHKQELAGWYSLGAIIAIVGIIGGFIGAIYSNQDDGLKIVASVMVGVCLYYIGLVMYDFLWNRRGTG